MTSSWSPATEYLRSFTYVRNGWCGVSRMSDYRVMTESETRLWIRYWLCHCQTGLPSAGVDRPGRTAEPEDITHHLGLAWWWHSVGTLSLFSTGGGRRRIPRRAPDYAKVGDVDWHSNSQPAQSSWTLYQLHHPYRRNPIAWHRNRVRL